MLPPGIRAELADCLGIPFPFLKEPLGFGHVETAGPDAVVLAGELLALHSDERCREVLLTGYERVADRDLIYIINRSGKLRIEEQYALIQRIKNESYRRKVFYRADEIINSASINLQAREVGIRFPLSRDEFNGWDHLRVLLKVSMIDARGEDWTKIKTSANGTSFEKCFDLEMETCFDFNFSTIANLFPEVENIVINDCHNFETEGIGQCQKLKSIEFRNSCGLSKCWKREQGSGRLLLQIVEIPESVMKSAISPSKFREDLRRRVRPGSASSELCDRKGRARWWRGAAA